MRTITTTPRSLSTALVLAITALGLTVSGCATGAPPVPLAPLQGDPGPPPQVHDHDHDHPPPHGIEHAVLFWLPNRLFDLVDPFRIRLRVGPGWTISARATELADVNLGAHSTIYVGLPGPRSYPRIPWPFGREVFDGLEVSGFDKTTEEWWRGPHYGAFEFGVGTQLLIVGFDVGLDFGEVFDFVVGIVFLDPMDDDY